MLLLPFLSDRRLGTIRKNRPFSSECRPNLDFLVSRLACSPEDVFVTHEQWYPAPPFSCKFRKDRELELLTVSNEEGDIYLIDTDFKGKIVKKFRAHNNAIFDISWVPDKELLVTGGGDFYCFLFDMRTYTRLRVFNYHTASVKSLDVCPQNTNLFAAGSKDGSISIWDMRDNNDNKPSIGITSAHVRIFNKGRNKRGETIKSSVSAVAFKDEMNLASTGVADSNIKIWDLRKTYSVRKDRPNQPSHPPVYKIDFSHTNSETFGFTSLAFDSLCSKLYACSSTNAIVQLDCHSYNKNNYVQYDGFKCSSYFVKMALSSDDQYILCGSSDHNAYVWNVDKPGLPIYMLPGHSAEVTSVAWSGYDNNKLATCGDDMKVFVWKSKNFDDANCKEVMEMAGIALPYSKSADDLSRPGQLSIKSIASSVTLIEKSKPNPKKRNSSPNTIHSFFSPRPQTKQNKSPHGSPPHPKLPSPLVLSPPQGCQTSLSTKGPIQNSPIISPTTSSSHGDASPPQNKSPTDTWPPEGEESFLTAGYINTDKVYVIPPGEMNDNLSPNIIAISHSRNVILTRPPPDPSSDASTMSASSPESVVNVPVSSLPSADIYRQPTTVDSCSKDIPQDSSRLPTIAATGNSCSKDIDNDFSHLPTITATETSCSKGDHDSSQHIPLLPSKNLPLKFSPSKSTSPEKIAATDNSCLKDGHLPTIAASDISCPKDSPDPSDLSTIFVSDNSCPKDSPDLSHLPTIAATENSCPKDRHQGTSHLPTMSATCNSSPKGNHHDTSPRMPLSPCKNLPSKFSPPNITSPEMATKAGKENGAEKSGKENGGANMESGSKKRKLESNDRSCRYHPEGCGRTRGGTRCGKKLIFTPAKDNIKNYFYVTPKKP